MVTDGLQDCEPFKIGSGAIGSPYNPVTMTISDAAALGTAAAPRSFTTRPSTTRTPAP
jgi:hypothetical protein